MSRPVTSRPAPAVKKSSMQQWPSRTHAPFHVSIFNWSNDDPKPKRHSAIPSAKANDGQDEPFPRMKTTSSPSAARRKWSPPHQSQQQSSQQSQLTKPPLPSASPHSNTLTPLSIPQEPEMMNGHGGGEKKFEKTRSTSTFLSSLRRKKRVDESRPQPQSQSDVAVAPPSLSLPSSPSTTRKRWFGLGGRSSSQVPVAAIVESARVAKASEGSMAMVNGVSNGGSVHLNGEQQQPQPLNFAQRIKLYKGLRTGKVPKDLLRQSQSHLVLAEKERERKKEKAGLFGSKKGDDSPSKENRRRGGKGKAFSADAINELDPYYLTEALLNIADEQPIVARSIPKHYVILPADERKAQERLKRDCLFEEKIYEDMLSDSQHVLYMLQSHLSDCIAGVRAKSPTALSSPFSSPPMTPVFGRPQSSSARPPSRTTPVGTISPPRVRISVSGANSATESTPQGSGRFPTRLGDRGGGSHPLISTSVTTDYRGGLAPSRSPMISVRRELSMANPAALPPLSPTMTTRKPSLGMAAEIGQQRTSPPFPVRAIITYNEPTKHDGRYQYFAA